MGDKEIESDLIVEVLCTYYANYLAPDPLAMQTVKPKILKRVK